MESYSKYADMARVPTCLLIDEPPVVLLGRTFSELVTSVVVFVAFAYFEEAWLGLVLAALTGGVLPMYRRRYVRGYLLHLGWALGLWFTEVKMFTPRRGVKVMGP